MKIIKVGRSSSNDIVIQNDPYVGRTHCQFIMDDNGDFRVIDLNSSNGTYVNGVRRSGETRLKPNDTIRIGNSMLPWQTYFNGYGTEIGGGKTIPYTPPITPNPPAIKPSNWLAPAILSTICCCVPFGIVSIVYASKVDNLWAAEDYDGAHEAARKAKTWFWVALSCGLVVGIFTAIYYLVIAGISFSDLL